MSFKAIQQTMQLATKEMGVLFREQEETVIGLFRPWRDMKEIRNLIVSQVVWIETLRLKALLADFQSIARRDGLSAFVPLALETLVRFCQFDMRVLHGIFGLKGNAELVEMINSIYDTQLNEYMNFLKKTLSENKRELDFRTALQLSLYACLYSQTIDRLEEEFKKATEDEWKSPPLFLSKFRETIQFQQEKAERILDDFSKGLDQLSIEALGFSFWDEFRRHSDELSFFLHNCQMGGSAEPLLVALRPLLNFLLRFRDENKNTLNLLYSFQAMGSLKAIVSSSQVAKYLPNLMEKLNKMGKELTDNIVSSMATKFNEIISKTADESKYDVFLLNLEQGTEGHWHRVLKTIQSAEPTFKDYFVARVVAWLDGVQQKLKSSKGAIPQKYEKQKKELKEYMGA